MSSARAQTIDEDDVDAEGFPRRYRMTVDQFTALVDSGAFADQRVELRDGDLVETAPQWMPHAWAKNRVQYGVRDALLRAGSPLEVGTEGSMPVGRYNVPEPDVFVWERERTAKGLPVECVRLVVEVCKTTHREDLGRKPGLYARAGIPEYWVVDLRARELRVMTAPTDIGYTNVATIAFGEPVRSPTLGIEIATDDLD